jgi:hypothetical protein
MVILAIDGEQEEREDTGKDNYPKQDVELGKIHIKED